MIDFDKTYDSHVHFFGVGIGAVEWLINGDNLSPPDHLMNKSLIKGFGLSPNITEDRIKSLYKNFPQTSFCLSYSDGHSSLVSKRLIDQFNFTPKNHKNHEHFVSLFENERDDFLKLLPKRTIEDLEKMALFAFDYFDKRGVKKVRHMTCTADQWSVFKKIYSSYNAPKLEVECLFADFMDQSLEEALKAYRHALETPISNITPQGIKIFVDGSIGQKTAYMSCFHNSQPRLSNDELFSLMKKILVDENSELALHTIGDLALEMSIEHYHRLNKEYGKIQTLHLEHAPIFTQRTLEILKNNDLDCTFHFQPSHWIGDSKWYLKEKHLLKSHAIYPFKKLDELGYRFYLGSDAPIEDSLIDLTLKGLNLIKQTSVEIT